MHTKRGAREPSRRCSKRCIVDPVAERLAEESQVQEDAWTPAFFKKCQPFPRMDSPIKDGLEGIQTASGISVVDDQPNRIEDGESPP
mmetsp:Transcript_96379/g.210760  ORF Transcript_96379/g.210760 Transcript_96379/m.210760 type:complete len:87 (-) Transcript_96379:3-263(-)